MIQQSTMRQQRATQVEAAFYSLLQTMFQMLRDDLAQHHLLGEVLRPHADVLFARGARTRGESEQRRQTGDNFRSTHPNPPSAASAINAAGTAPARICVVSSDETPRKMKTPSPPPPIRAAMVAVPMVVTVATRIPAMMVGAAKGIWTWRSNCPSVIPMATADSQTADSTPRIPTKVFRRIGSSAYRTSATIAVRLPIPPMNGIGIKKPSNARLGMVCMMFANPSSQGRAAGRRVR